MKKIYFISDAHLGSLMVQNPREQELRLISFLDAIKEDAAEIFLLGDMFDFWFEYKTVVPKGQVRFLGKLAELTDKGIVIHFFTGNHDLWTFGYLAEEIGLQVHKTPEIIERGNKKFFLAHGDGLQDTDKGFAFIRWVFHNKVLQQLFSFVPPRIGLGFAKQWSKSNRKKDIAHAYGYQGEEKELLVQFAKKFSQQENIDFYIFGHRHILLDLQLAQKNRIVIIGDWLTLFSYAVWDGENLELNQYEPTQ